MPPFHVNRWNFEHDRSLTPFLKVLIPRWKKKGKFENKASGFSVFLVEHTRSEDLHRGDSCAGEDVGRDHVSYRTFASRKGAVYHQDHGRGSRSSGSDVHLYKSLQEATRPFAAAATRYARTYLLYVSFCFLFNLVGEMRMSVHERVWWLENSSIRFTYTPFYERINHAFQPLSPRRRAFRYDWGGSETKCVFDAWIF